MKHIKQQVVITLFFITLPAINFTMEYKYKKTPANIEQFRKICSTLTQWIRMYHSPNKNSVEKSIEGSQKNLANIKQGPPAADPNNKILQEFNKTLKEVNKNNTRYLYSKRQFYLLLKTTAQILNDKCEEKINPDTFNNKLILIAKKTKKIPYIKKIGPIIEKYLDQESQNKQKTFDRRLANFKNLLSTWANWPPFLDTIRQPSSCPTLQKKKKFHRKRKYSIDYWLLIKRKLPIIPSPHAT